MYVEADVRNALEQWYSARVRYDAAVIARKAAEEQYESEQRQFQVFTEISCGRNEISPRQKVHLLTGAPFCLKQASIHMI